MPASERTIDESPRRARVAAKGVAMPARALARAALLLAGFAVGGCETSPTELPARIDGTLRVATYNVHYIVLSEPTGAWSVGDWERRKRPLDAAFDTLDADIVAFQEMESFAGGSGGEVNLTLDWLLARDPDYAAAAVGEAREFPSTQPILYRADRLTVLEQGWFFFSETPDVIYSRTFDGSYPAFASWARFEDLDSRETVSIVNVHFEFESFSNRRKSAELVARRIGPRTEAGERVLLVGDLNAWHGMRPIEILEEIGLSFLPVRGATYHMNRGIDLIGAIDHITHSPGLRPLGAPVVVRRKFEGEWPSDHYPVIADVR